MNPIANLFYALKICRKYKLKFSTFCPINHGEYSWEENKIFSNIFNSNFKSIFLHEVGHHLDHKRSDYSKFFETTGLQFSNTSRCIYKVLESESKASKFAIRVGGVNKPFLRQAFNTYTSPIFKNLGSQALLNEFDKIVSHVYKTSKRLK